MQSSFQDSGAAGGGERRVNQCGAVRAVRAVRWQVGRPAAPKISTLSGQKLKKGLLADDVKSLGPGRKFECWCHRVSRLYPVKGRYIDERRGARVWSLGTQHPCNVLLC